MCPEEKKNNQHCDSCTTALSGMRSKNGSGTTFQRPCFKKFLNHTHKNCDGNPLVYYIRRYIIEVYWGPLIPIKDGRNHFHELLIFLTCYGMSALSIRLISSFCTSYRSIRR